MRESTRRETGGTEWISVIQQRISNRNVNFRKGLGTWKKEKKILKMGN